MHGRCSLLTAVFTVLALELISAAAGWAASRETVLYAFKGGADGESPVGNLVADKAGNLYGATYYGGAYGLGTVFELVRSGGAWKESVIHAFGGLGDGKVPNGGLILDGEGNLYGTAQEGGADGNCPDGCGIVFELAPSAGGVWNETVIHEFGGAKGDGAIPMSGMLAGPRGNMYGTTAYGGTGACNGGCGAVFEMTPSEGGMWAGRVIHSFDNTDGEYAAGGLVLDGRGDLYGATYEGGVRGCGAAFKLSPSRTGLWAESVLYSFEGCPEGPLHSLVFDRRGNLYGATQNGGIFGAGTAYELSPGSGGRWTETVLHTFGGGKDGRFPMGSFVIDGGHDLYGSDAGSQPHEGKIIELMPVSEAQWEVRVLYSFTGGKDGGDPQPLIFGPNGKLQGVGAAGGDMSCNGGNGCGVVFEVTR